MRIFVAVTFNEVIKDKLIHLQTQLKSKCCNGNWTVRNNLHITLYFIGDTHKNQLPLLQHTLQVLSRNHKTFSITIGNLGCFRRQDTLLWAGLTSGQTQLKEIHQELSMSLSRFQRSNAPNSSNFKPHITLARRVQLSKSEFFMMQQLPFNNMAYQVEEISLMESTRINGQLIYKTLYTFPLKA